MNLALAKNNRKFDTGNEGIVKWIQELLWREFFKEIAFVSTKYPLIHSRHIPEYASDSPLSQRQRTLRGEMTRMPWKLGSREELGTLSWYATFAG